MTFLILACCVSLQAAERPNILFFLVDDMGTQDTSVPFHYDAARREQVTKLNKLYRTPHMEALAEQGRKFSNALAYSVCTPTRVSLLTGQAAPRHRVTTWTHPHHSTIDTGAVAMEELMGPEWHTHGVSEHATLLTHLLKEVGYTTLMAGKAHFGPNDTQAGDPLNLGFDVNIAGHGGGGLGSYHGQKKFSAVWRGGGKLWDVPSMEKYHGEEIFITEALTREMKQAISKAVADKKPFFAYMSHYAVHAPFEVDPRFEKNYPDLKGHSLAFATMVEGMDQSLGDLMRHLEVLGVAEDTLIIFYSDNGSDSPLRNAPLRGKKGTRFEGGSRVPMIAAWAKPDPKNMFQQKLPIPAKTVEHGMVSCLDMMPTILGIAGVKLPEKAIVDGHDITPYLRAESGHQGSQSFLVHFPHGRHNNTLFTSFRHGAWKLIYNYEPRTWELYDLSSDVGERHNVVSKKTARARALADLMMQELRAQNAQFPLDKKSREPVLPDLSRIK